jgi:regulator of sigma E protease
LEVQSSPGQISKVEIDASAISIYKINPGFLVQTLGLVPSRPEPTTKLQRILPESPADQAGLQPDDHVISIDGQAVASWDELVELVSSAPSRSLDFVIIRDAVELRLMITPRAEQVNGETVGRIGVAPQFLPYADEQRVQINRNVLQAAIYGVEQTWLMSTMTLQMLWKMVTLEVSHTNINGPITIAEVAGQAIQIGLDYYLHILAVISISLGVMNLLPIPMLDGGHLLMYVVEAVAGQDVSKKVFLVGQQFGVLLLICLMSLAFYNDIFRLLN